MGTQYNFKVQARNKYGFSLFSETLTILAAQKPSQPAAPITQISGANVLIKWSAPVSGGSAITSYDIKILASDGTTYYREPSGCDGTSAQIISNTECLVSISTLRQAPFNLAWGSSIQVKIIATNTYGSSVESL